MTNIIVGFRNFANAPRNRWIYATLLGRAMAQEVSRRPLTSEARVRSRVSQCGICGGQSGIGTGFRPSTSVFPCQFHSTGAPLHGKTKEKNLSSSSQGCTISFKASAAGPFKKYIRYPVAGKSSSYPHTLYMNLHIDIHVSKVASSLQVFDSICVDISLT
jgi:hypothetical protein